MPGGPWQASAAVDTLEWGTMPLLHHPAGSPAAAIASAATTHSVLERAALPSSMVATMIDAADDEPHLLLIPTIASRILDGRIAMRALFDVELQCFTSWVRCTKSIL